MSDLLNKYVWLPVQKEFKKLIVWLVSSNSDIRYSIGTGASNTYPLGITLTLMSDSVDQEITIDVDVRYRDEQWIVVSNICLEEDILIAKGPSLSVKYLSAESLIEWFDRFKEFLIANFEVIEFRISKPANVNLDLEREMNRAMSDALFEHVWFPVQIEFKKLISLVAPSNSDIGYGISTYTNVLYPLEILLIFTGYRATDRVSVNITVQYRDGRYIIEANICTDGTTIAESASFSIAVEGLSAESLSEWIDDFGKFLTTNLETIKFRISKPN
ncbi:hypothetical protein J2Z48_003139 [Croceifilum oryzae]|uniref:Uncharacterized protein n=1 Tax=Croceifilum oryzae TaxID=1553429 RepID=A0AAJ1TI48_9BACL|nr:hypothetical protein [Croceifilum oryzae]MDQ0418934.1 hypothetical protein [Croceifilum oryzae]